MFNLNEEVIKWRNALTQSEAFGGADIDELEGHLREEIERLAAAGLSEQEAFLVAGHRLGDTRSLESEFAKVNAGHILRTRLFWMAAGVLAYLLAGCLAGASGNAGALIAGLGGLGPYGAGVLGVAAGLLGFVVALVLIYSVCKRNSKVLSFNRLTSDFRGKVVLLTSLLVSVAVLGAAQALFRVLMVRTMGMDDISRLGIVSAYVGLILPILLPVVLMVVLIKLRLSGFRAAPR
jgi:hypothetical protein